MNQEKIGKFILERRKKKNLTQEQLAKKLGISDRAVSKWERGINMPDASLMIELSKILGISVNELLSGEELKEKDYVLSAEQNLIKIVQEEEKNNKRLITCEWVIGLMSSISFITLIFVSSYFVQDNLIRILLFILAFIIFIVGISFSLMIEAKTGYYECKFCHNRYVPSYKKVYFAIHFGTTRYLKCPKCRKRSFNKKVLSK